MPSELRCMILSDLNGVLRNERSGYTHPWTEGVFRDCLRNEDECWLLLHNGINVGHGILSVAAGESHLLNVCVNAQYQGCGFGLILVKHMLARARKRSATSIFLEVRPSNTAACELYEKLGFNEVGIRENYYPAKVGREDALVMAKELF